MDGMTGEDVTSSRLPLAVGGASFDGAEPVSLLHGQPEVKIILLKRQKEIITQETFRERRHLHVCDI